MDVIGWIGGTAASLPVHLVWILGGLFAFLEAGLGLGFLVPGETVVLLLAASLDSPSKAAVLVAAVTVGASSGDHVGYLLGRRLGPRLRETRVIQRLGVANWDRTVSVLEKHGAIAVFLTRLVPVVRTLTPAAAGTARVPYLRFLPASLAGALTWALLGVGLGYLLRSSLDAVQGYLGSAGWILLAVAGVVIAGLFGRARLRRRRLGRATVSVSGTGGEDDCGPQADSFGVAPVRRTVRERVDGRTGARALFVARLVSVLAAGVCAGLALYFTTAALLAFSLLAKPIQARLRLDRRRSRWTEPTLDRLSSLSIATGLTLGSFLPWQLLVLLLVPDLILGIGSVLAVHGILPLPVGRTERARAATQLTALLSITVGLSALVHLSMVVAPGSLLLVGLLLMLVGLILEYVVAALHMLAMLRLWAESRRPAHP